MIKRKGRGTKRRGSFLTPRNERTARGRAGPGRGTASAVEGYETIISCSGADQMRGLEPGTCLSGPSHPEAMDWGRGTSTSSTHPLTAPLFISLGAAPCVTGIVGERKRPGRPRTRWASVDARDQMSESEFGTRGLPILTCANRISRPASFPANNITTGERSQVD